MKSALLLLGAVLASALSTPAFAARLGDPAAPLAIKNWVQGKPVDVKDGKNIYVVEFWATWCGPCKVSIPHLTELQAKFKDKGVVMVGISDEDEATVKPFVKQMGAKMAYTVACDNDRKSNAGYMEAYKQGGIPTAFIVGKQGNVLWFGHPMDGLDETLQEIVDGKYNLQTAIKRDELRATMDEYQELSSTGSAKAREVGRKLLVAAGDNADALSSLAFSIVTNSGNKNRDFALAEEAMQQADKIAGGKTGKVQGIRAIGLFESGKLEAGLAAAKEAVSLSKTPQEKATNERFVSVMETRIKSEGKAAAPAKK